MPRRGSAPGGRNKISGASEISTTLGGVQYTWQGQAVLNQVQEVLDSAFEIIRQRAQNYWRSEEWTREKHPHMSGTERDSGFFHVTRAANMVVQLEFGATAPWTFLEEYGSSVAGGNRKREGHHPIRNTLDRVGYRVADVVRSEAGKRGLRG